MSDIFDTRPELIVLMDEYLATNTDTRKAELANLLGVTAEAVDNWRKGEASPDGVMMRYAMSLLRQRCG